MLEQGCPWQLPKRSTRPISARFAGFGAGSGRDGAFAVRPTNRGGRWLVNDGGRVCSFSSACRSPLIDPCDRTSPARPSSAIATALLSLWTSSPMNSNGFIAVGSVWFFIEAAALRPAFAALQPPGCNPRIHGFKLFVSIEKHPEFDVSDCRRNVALIVRIQVLGSPFIGNGE